MTNPRIGGNGDFKGSTRRMLVVAKGALLPEWFLIVIASLFRGSVSGNNWKKREVERKRRGRGICSLPKVAPQEFVQMNSLGYIRNFFFLRGGGGGGGGGGETKKSKCPTNAKCWR